MAYEKRGGFADTSGQDYEVDICALLFLRGLRLCADIHLATNHSGAGAFDDAVLVFRPHYSEKYSAILLQAKHKKNAKITTKTLKGSKNDFTLVKYFKSFVEMGGKWNSVMINEQEEELEEVVYVLYTNARADLRATAVDITNSSEHQVLSQLLLTGGRMVKISHSPVADVLSTVDSSQAQTFLAQLVLCYEQMDHDAASKFIEEEIALILNSGHENITKIRHRIIKLMKEWWAESADVSYLSRQSDLWKTVVRAEIDRLNSGTINLKSDLALRFTDCCISKFTSLIQTSNRIALIVSDEDEACILRMKLYDALECQIVLLYGMDLKQKLGEALCILKTSFCNVLVIDTSSGLGKDTLSEIMNEITIDASKTVIVIATEEFDGYGFSITKERCSWSDLDNTSAKLLSTSLLNLQGFQLSLEDYGKYDPGFTDALSARHILHIAGNPKEITLGKRFGDGVPYYVPRRMEKRAFITDSFFEFAKEQLLIITITGTTIDKVQEKFGKRFEIYTFNDMEKVEIIETSCLVLLLSDAYDLQFDKLCARYECEIYMIELIDNEFLYLRSRNGLHNARKHLKDKCSESIHLDWNTKIKNVVVEGAPGIGKSSFLSWLVCTMKSHGSKDWIIRIELGRYTDMIRNKDFKNDEEIKAFLEYTCLANDNRSGIERALFRRALDVSGNIVLLIDAFDEISPDYTQACIRLLKNLKLMVKYKQLLVTTRPVTMLDVENVLDTFSYSITGFNKEEQLLFLKSYCLNKGIEFTENNLCTIVKSVGRCLEVPLLAFIAAEVLLQGEFFPEKETILYGKVKLYDIFVEKQIGIFLLEKHGMSSSTAFQSEILDNIKMSLCEKLMNLAVNTVLTDEEREKVGFKKKDEGLLGSKIGLVLSSEDKVYFVHHTFAEFFFGVWLSKNFADCGNIIESKLFEDNFEFVRESFSSYLHRELPLHSAVSEGDILRVEKLVVAEGALSSVDAGGRTPLHVAAINAEVNDTIWNMLTTDLQVLDKRDLILSWTALTYAEAVSNWKAADFLLSKGSSVDCLRLLKEKKKAKGVLRDTSMNGLFRLTMAILQLHKNLLIEPLDYRGNYVLHCAAASGSVRLVSELVKAGAPLDSLDRGRFTAICVAAEKGHVDVVSFLHKKGASMEASIASPLHFATLSNSSAVVNYLTHGEDGSNEENIPLIEATKSNDSSTVMDLLQQGADANERDNRGMTALHWASTCENAEIAQLLLNAGSEIESRNNEGTIPLMWACIGGHNNVVKVLLESGANVNCVGEDGNAALNGASYTGHAHTVQLLLRHGADVNHKNKKGRTALTAACMKGNLDVVRLLLDANAIIDTSDEDGASPLIAASFMGHTDLVQLFINAGADVNITDKGGRTALMLAAANNHNDVIQVLKAAGAKIVRNGEELEKSMELSDVNKNIEADQIKIIDNTETKTVLQVFFVTAWNRFKGCWRCREHVITDTRS